MTDLQEAAAPAVPWTPEGSQDPHPWFARMLAGPSPWYHEPSDVWCFFAYRDVQAFLQDTGTWSLAKKLERIAPEKRYARLLSTDPPRHAEVRGLFSHAYRPRRVSSLEPRIRAIAAELIDAALEKGSLDVVAEVADPLATRVIALLMGVPDDDIGELSTLTLRNANGSMERSPDGRPAMNIWMGDRDPDTEIGFDRYYRQLIRSRKEHPGDDLITDLAMVDADSFSQALHLGTLLDEQFGSGRNTTVHAVGSILALLHRYPDQLARLRARPALLAPAIEEGLRYWAPVQGRARIAARPVPVEGGVIEEGSVVVSWVQAANRDPAQFADPERFDITRSPNRHLTFGYGEHYCLGASVARLELRVFFEEWLARVASWHRTVDGPLVWQPMYMLRGLDRLDLELVASGG